MIALPHLNVNSTIFNKKKRLALMVLLKEKQTVTLYLKDLLSLPMFNNFSVFSFFFASPYFYDNNIDFVET
jgi:hypothetical protein